jgi:hypothetical protein
MAYSTITKPSLYFNTKLYTGNGTDARSITGVGFQPDWVWIKDRDSTGYHNIFDSIRGATKRIHTNTTGSENTTAESLQSFNSDGFTVGTNTEVNKNNDNYASWNWKAGTTSGITTTGADITPSSYSMNATSGISIIKFTGNGVDGAKIAHGLGAVPELIISKRLENSNYWAVYHKTDATDYLVLNTTAAFSDAPIWKDTAPTSVYYQTDNSTSVNPSGETVVAYCFKSVKGYSKIGTYTGNGNANGTFVYTGFKPAFTIIKQSSASGQNWQITDNKRNSFNTVDKLLYANENNAEVTSGSHPIDFLSNGFKCRGTGSGNNTSGATYIYMAFAAEPLVANVGASIPATAK